MTDLDEVFSYLEGAEQAMLSTQAQTQRGINTLRREEVSMVAPRKRVQLLVEMDLDPVPGTFNTPESACEQTQGLISDMVPHYHPTVTLVEQEPDIPQFLADDMARRANS